MAWSDGKPRFPMTATISSPCRTVMLMIGRPCASRCAAVLIASKPCSVSELPSYSLSPWSRATANTSCFNAPISVGSDRQILTVKYSSAWVCGWQPVRTPIVMPASSNVALLLRCMRRMILAQIVGVSIFPGRTTAGNAMISLATPRQLTGYWPEN